MVAMKLYSMKRRHRVPGCCLHPQVAGTHFARSNMKPRGTNQTRRRREEFSTERAGWGTAQVYIVQ